MIKPTIIFNSSIFNSFDILTKNLKAKGVNYILFHRINLTGVKIF